MLTIYKMPTGEEIAEVTSLEAALAVSRMQGDVWLYAMTRRERETFIFIVGFLFYTLGILLLGIGIGARSL